MIVFEGIIIIKKIEHLHWVGFKFPAYAAGKLLFSSEFYDDQVNGWLSSIFQHADKIKKVHSFFDLILPRLDDIIF